MRPADDETPIRVAYADPPYLGMASYYDHPESAVYDTLDGHRALIARLCDDYPDGWAYSLHSPSLRHILPLCPDDCRVGAWVKPMCFFKPGVNPGYGWEPVIFRGGRKKHRYARTVRDWTAVNSTQGRGFFGAKPENFAFWLFQLFGLRPGDTFDDLFPGSGAVGRAWQEWCRLTDGLFPMRSGA
jgi:hypothetical protein